MLRAGDSELADRELDRPIDSELVLFEGVGETAGCGGTSLSPLVGTS